MSNEVTFSEVDAVCAQLIELEGLYDLQKNVFDETKAEISRLEFELMKLFEKTKQESYRFGGKNFLAINHLSVKVPKGDDRIEFFNFLKSTGQLETVVSLSSASLCKWYKDESEAARIRGEIFAAPGIAIPTEYKTITMRKSK